ncbi:DUF2505 domain-containing protein [Pengzhenrongella sicca]|uniref:DUF2505 domain-containing protein n=1 Tax=Pengzhenrongella sicca TaxID=2819238 RepID=A0A8A4ZGX8_9MICO|nr:DUF2505 domain-containing protein [Pengzhenrongella sicca]QTE30213.1 DUF2505 domain-containing protein [Pengzhenrongella sicca]
MRVHVQLRYPATVATVAAMLADPAYGHARVAASGAVAHHVDVVDAADGAFTVTTRRSMPTDQIPANFRAFVGTSLDVRQVEAWEAGTTTRHGTVVVEITGAPVRLTGTTTLAPVPDAASPDGAEPGASLLTYDGDVKAGVPLFGAAIEEAAARAVRAALEAEQQAGSTWLGIHPRGSSA